MSESTITPVFDYSLIAGIKQEVQQVEESNPINKYLLDLSSDIPDPEPVITQGTTNVCTKGNFSCITGQAKSRKTFLISSMVGAFFSPCGFLGMDGAIEGTVLYIDTEQSLPHVKKIVQRIHRIIGWDEYKNDERLKVLCLRELSPEERKKTAEHAIKTFAPIICVIDGVADLMKDTNSNEEAISIASLLLKLTSECECHIITALHTNPNSDKARGHIGSEIIRKAETVLNVSKDGDTSTVKAAYCRDIELEDFSFEINNRGLPELCAPLVKTSKEDDLRFLFSRIMEYGLRYKRVDLTDKITSELKVSKRTADNRVSEALRYGIIHQSEKYYSLQEINNKEYENLLPF